MRRLVLLVAGLLGVLVLVGCSSGGEARTEPFVGQWESTGGEQISLTVQEPEDGTYPVRIQGGTVDLQLDATKSGDDTYRATPSTGTVWTFTLVDEDLLRATAAPEGSDPATTSFKRVGE